MADKSKIEWTDATWNPIRGCTVVSEGCRHCYAMSVAARFSGPGQAYEGLAYRNSSGAHWTNKVRFVEEHLEDPLKWKRPRRIFVNSMSDLFHESIPDEWIVAVFRVMEAATARRHTFQVLTKRPQRMFEFVSKRERTNPHLCPAPNVWFGVSVEDQKTADERIPLLLQTPAAVRFVSAEPLLNWINLENYLYTRYIMGGARHMHNQLDWVIVGGESGVGARPFNIRWARSLVRQCATARVACFVKQLGAKSVDIDGVGESVGTWPLAIKDKKGGNIDEWPGDLRVRQMPKFAHAVTA